MMSSSGFYRDLINNNPALLGKILVFNSRPTKSVPEGMPAPLAEAVAHDAELLGKIRSDETYSLHGEKGYWAFTSPSERLALMPPEELARLGKMCAAALMADRLACVVEKNDVLAVKAFLGPEIYRWVLCRGRFMPGSLARDTKPYQGKGPVADELERFARSIIETVRAEWPDALQARSSDLFMSIPLAEAQAIDAPSAFVGRLWYLMKKLILQEFDKKWTPFFN